jgi:hypothetical protein
MPIKSASHIMNFKATIDAEGGPITSNRYLFCLGGYPRVLQAQNKYRHKAGSLIQSLRYLCDVADLPGITIHTNTRPGYSPDMKQAMPGEIEFGQINISMICRDYMSEKEFFDDWMFSIKNAHRGGIGPTFDNAYLNDIVVDAQIYVMSHYNTGNGQDTDTDESAQVRYAINLINLYPTSMDNIPLSWQDDSTMKLNVTFCYARWEPIQGSSMFAHSSIASSFSTPPARQLLNYNKPRG